VTRSPLPHLWEQGIPQDGEDDFWVGEAVVLHITTPYTPQVPCDNINDLHNGHFVFSSL